MVTSRIAGDAIGESVDAARHGTGVGVVASWPYRSLA